MAVADNRMWDIMSSDDLNLRIAGLEARLAAIEARLGIAPLLQRPKEPVDATPPRPAAPAVPPPLPRSPARHAVPEDVPMAAIVPPRAGSPLAQEFARPAAQSAAPVTYQPPAARPPALAEG